MLRKLAALLVAFALSMPATILTNDGLRTARAQISPIPPGLFPKPIILDDNPGGAVRTFVYFFNAIRDSGVPVRVRGLCVSACTLVLALPHDQVCMESTGSFGFHLATDDGEKGNVTLTAALQRRYYSSVVMKWLEGKKLKLESVVYMQSDEAAALDIFPMCAD